MKFTKKYCSFKYIMRRPFPEIIIECEEEENGIVVNYEILNNKRILPKKGSYIFKRTNGSDISFSYNTELYI